MALCSGIRADGGRCRAQAITDSEWCFSHHPDYEEQRRWRASKGGRRGGRGRPISELARLQGWFEELAEQVLEEDEEKRLDRATAAVACQLLNGARACVRDGLVAREKEELEAQIKANAERLAAIENVLKLRSAN